MTVGLAHRHCDGRFERCESVGDPVAKGRPIGRNPMRRHCEDFPGDVSYEKNDAFAAGEMAGAIPRCVSVDYVQETRRRRKLNRKFRRTHSTAYDACEIYLSESERANTGKRAVQVR